MWFSVKMLEANWIMKKGIEDVINSITLQDMIDDYNKNILENDITNLILK